MIQRLENIIKSLRVVDYRFNRESDLLNVEIFLPPIDEQRRIASILDKADELRKSANNQLKS